MTPRLRTILLSCVVAALPGTTLAQSVAMPDEESPARIHLGPISVRPELILREVGFDSNARHDAEGGRGDFTATIGLKAASSMRARRVHLQGSHFYEYRHFQALADQRGSNRGTDGRVDVLVGPIRPYLEGSVASVADRPSTEVDARARRLESRAGVGLHAAVFSRTSMHLGWRRTSVDYAEDELFRGVRLADELNGASGALLLAADLQLSPLTTVSVHGEHSHERFERSPLRDADSSRAGLTVSLDPQALISGRVTAGVRAFRPVSGEVPAFTGLTAAVAAGYAYRDQARIGLTLDRDVRHSVDALTPYYLSTSGRVTFVHRLFGRFDGQLLAGGERLAYQSRYGANHTRLHDRVRTAGGGIGIRVAERSRLAVIAEHSTRASATPGHGYSRSRIFATLAYGF